MTSRRQKKGKEKELRAKVPADVHAHVMKQCARLGITYKVLVGRVLGRKDLASLYIQTIK